MRRTGYPEHQATFATSADAEVWARQREAELDRGVFVDDTEAQKNTLAQLFERHRREVTPTKRGWHSETCRLKAFAQDEIAQLRNVLSAKTVLPWRSARPKSRIDSSLVLGPATNRGYAWLVGKTKDSNWTNISCS